MNKSNFTTNLHLSRRVIFTDNRSTRVIDEGDVYNQLFHDGNHNKQPIKKG